jgi:hypothetical protein
MNTGLKNILILTLGVGIGAFVTYQILNKKYAALAQEEIESVRQVFGRGEPKNSINREFDGGYIYNDSKTDIDLTDKTSMHPNITPNMAEKSRYKKLVRKYTPYNEVTKGRNGDVVNTFEVGPDRDDPSCYIISIEEFSNERPEYDKISISYYETDDTLADETDEIVPDVETLIGEALLCFGDQSDDPDVVYVRNECISIDYEIIRLHKSYQETVLGIKMVDDRGPTTRTIRRRLNDDSR